MITHETRRESHNSIDEKKRYNQILSILEGSDGMSAREVAVEMCKRHYAPTSERNFSAPRLNELVAKKEVEVIGKRKCPYSNKNVAIYKVVEKCRK